jgi:hypothetical protein
MERSLLQAATRLSRWGRSLVVLVVAAAVVIVVGGQASAMPQKAHIGAGAEAGTALPACSQLNALGIPKQQNLRAYESQVACGREAAGGTGPRSSPQPGKRQIGSGNVDAINVDNAFPTVTQSEDQVFANGAQVIVHYNDSVGGSDISVSNDGGQTFARQSPSPFAAGHGTNFGDPILVYNRKLGKWFAGDLVTGCGGFGVGLWSSTNGTSWPVGACPVNENNADRESMAVDNNQSSPFYGRMYITWNDFNVAGGALFLTHSDDGTTWSPPLQLSPSFIRDVQVLVAANGNVLSFALNEGGGGFNPRQNFVFRSVNGGVSFSGAISMGATFPAPGDALSGNPYFPKINPIWRFTGYGDAAAGANGVVVYSYTVHGTAGTDGGDTYIVRSTDSGATWRPPLRVDGDASGHAQWMPSAAGGGSQLMVAWYDRRHTTNSTNYERWGVLSSDGGATWSQPQRISDVLIPQPEQPDPAIVAEYAGDYMRDYFDGSTFYDAWTDGRIAISGHFQQDVETERLTVQQPGPDYVGMPDGTTVGIVPGSTNIGNNCDDCTTSVTFPFTVDLYGIPYSSANVESNGTIQFDTALSNFTNGTLPTTAYGAALFPYWDDLQTLTANNPGDGIFTATTGAAPNRTFYIEWRAHRCCGTGTAAVNFEVAFRENSSTVRYIYGPNAEATPGSSATIGVQSNPTGSYTELGANVSGLIAAGKRFELLIPTTPSPAGGAHVLIVYSDGGPVGQSSHATSIGTGHPQSTPATFRNQLAALPGVAAVDDFDASTSTPSLALLSGYQAVVPFSNFAYFDPVTLGNELADYEQSNNGVVVGFAYDWFGSGQTIQGRWLSGGFSPFNSGGGNVNTPASLGTFTAGHPLMTGVSTLNDSNRQGPITVASGANVVAKWNDGVPLIASQVNSTPTPTTGKRSVGVTGYIGDFAPSYSGDFAKIVTNAVHWLSPSLDTVPPSAVGIPALPGVPPFLRDKAFLLKWNGGADPGSGFAGFDITDQVAPLNGGFGPFNPLLTGTTATSFAFVGTPGSTVCFRGVAHDVAGNVSAANQRCVAVPLDDSALTRAGTWSTVSGGSYYNGTASTTTTNGSSLNMTSVTTKQIGVLVTKCPGCGQIQVFLGGVLRGTFDLNAGGTAYRQIVTMNLPALTTGAFQIVNSNGLPTEIDGVGFSRS